MNDLFSSKTVAVLLVGVVAVVLLGFSNTFPKLVETPSAPVPGAVNRQQMTLSGTYLCLPHVDTTGPQTMECAFGIQTDDGVYYSLDLNLLADSAPTIQTSEYIVASGIMTPVEMLSSDHWKIYPIKGIFSVTDLKVTPKP